MTNQDCIFCKIISKEIPSEIVTETDTVTVIKDLHPKAPIHYLILPKTHITNLIEAHDEDMPGITDALNVARQLAQDLEDPKGFNLISNNGASAGQSVFHLHFHFLAGRNIYSTGLSL